MKNTYIFTTLIIFMLAFAACDDKIDVDLNDAEPRLVIEASIDWEKGTAGNEQLIKLSTSTPYFDTTQNVAVTGAIVTITNDNSGITYNFTDQNNGNYTVSNFVPQLNQSYTLNVLYEGETYIATETMTSVTGIADVTQSREGGFDEDLLEVTVFFDDPAGIENFYLIRFKENTDLFPFLTTRSDEFTDGNVQEQFFEKSSDDDNPEDEFNSGDVVNIQLFGISEQYYNYITLLIEQYQTAGNPFSTVPAEIRGNCINLTNEENYAFGYFRLTQFEELTYTFQ